MNEANNIGLDLAKNVFQAHGAAADGSVVFRRKLTRLQVLKFFAEQPRCVRNYLKAGTVEPRSATPERPKADRYAARVIALLEKGLSYRLIARDLGLSKNTVMDIVQRHRATDVQHLSA